jgi:hypothetical protein
MRRFLLAFFLLMSGGIESASAQRRPRMIRVGDPTYWITGGVAGFTGTGVNDGRTASSWDFGNSTNFQYRASIEKSLANGSAIGIAGSHAHVPFLYSNGITPLPSGVTGARCGTCDAHLDMTTLVGVFRAGSGIGFHQVIELSGGVVAYRNLTQDNGGAKLAPSGGNVDPIFSIGYGIGYGFSPTTQINFVPDYAIAIHERSGLSNGTSNTNSMRALRLSLRLGFGG